MNITIEIAPDKEEMLAERAKSSGHPNVAEYVKGLINKDLTAPSLDELLRPVREEFEASGMTDEELDSLIEVTREEVWQDKPGVRRKGS